MTKRKQYRHIMFILLIVLWCILFFRQYIQKALILVQVNNSLILNYENISTWTGWLIVQQARKQIGIVNSYDSSYYQDWYPPVDRGACTDVIIDTLEWLWYPFKKKIDSDILVHKNIYGIVNPDPNIDFRRVRIVKIFLEQYAESLSINTQNFNHRQAGDIVTFDQIPGGLWHIGIVSSKRADDGRPLLIHNYGFWTTEDDMLMKRPAKISWHYRVINLL